MVLWDNASPSQFVQNSQNYEPGTPGDGLYQFYNASKWLESRSIFVYDIFILHIKVMVSMIFISAVAANLSGYLDRSRY